MSPARSAPRRSGPVFITDRGRPAHVLLSIGDYRRLAGGRRSLLDALSMPGLADIDFEAPRVSHREPADRPRLMFLLDTNVVSELRKAGDGRADARVAAWIAAEDAAGFYISALTLMELEIVILRVERRDTGAGKAAAGAGWTVMSCPSSRSAPCRSMPPWR